MSWPPVGTMVGAESGAWVAVEGLLPLFDEQDANTTAVAIERMTRLDECPIAAHCTVRSVVTAATWQSRRRAVASLLGSAALTASCASGRAEPTPTSPNTAVVTASIADTLPATTAAVPPTMHSDSTEPPKATTTAAAVVDRNVLTGITMTSVPADVIVPTSDATLDKTSNPINGRRGSAGRLPTDLDCQPATTLTCLAGVLDQLGFNVTTGSQDQRGREVVRATAVVQLDAGLTVTGVADQRLRDYLGVGASSTGASETRLIGTSARGRPINAHRYGNGSRIVLVVGQTHGDEEGGLRVLLRARTLGASLLDGVTLWVVPTMNPDGLVADTRFLADGADPNRKAPSEPEQQAVYDFALAIRPSLTIWYHQNYGWVGGSGASMAPAKQYQALTNLGTLKRSGNCQAGFMWCPIDDALSSSSILVELPDVLTPADVQSHALALLEVASGHVP